MSGVPGVRGPGGGIPSGSTKFWWWGMARAPSVRWLRACVQADRGYKHWTSRSQMFQTFSPRRIQDYYRPTIDSIDPCIKSTLVWLIKRLCMLYVIRQIDRPAKRRCLEKKSNNFLHQQEHFSITLSTTDSSGHVDACGERVKSLVFLWTS
jgi:hypothetical protein